MDRLPFPPRRLALGTLALLTICIGVQAETPNGPFAGWATNGPAVFKLFVSSTQAQPGPAVAYRPPSMALPLEIRQALAQFRAARNVVVISNTTQVFDHYLAESLNNAIWTNFLAHTNAQCLQVWSTRTYAGWPERPPVVKWNRNCLMWGMKGLTAMAPSWQVSAPPVTALTRRHGYTRGHSMGPDRIGTTYAGKKVWFLTAQDRLVETTVLREIVRTREVSNKDYTLLLFSSDLPETIDPMRVIGAHEVFWTSPTKYPFIPGAPYPIFKTEQHGNVSAEVPGFTLDVLKVGDSGSPEMVPLPGELAFWRGRTTSPPDAGMQADMDRLCRLQGLDPKKYQLQYVDLSAYPTY